jgi:phosphoribosylaminoimidazole-succinocarboxamide synthase
MNEKALIEIPPIALKLFRRGKVREVFELNGNLLIVATDRISAFDYVLPNGIPDKGKILTQLSLFWFDFCRDIIPNHVITGNASEFPAVVKKHISLLEKRSMLVKKAERFDIECVARGYLAGSGWREYQQKGSICGIKLPSGLKESSKLPEVIFTPATKSDSGHDINIKKSKATDIVGHDVINKLEEMSIKIYEAAARYAETRGIIIADSKFEFGVANGELILIDEVLTPDSSRFWPMKDYSPGSSQVSFDKQFVRDYLESINWDKSPPVPTLPEEIVIKTREKYLEAFRSLTGRDNI